MYEDLVVETFLDEYLVAVASPGFLECLGSRGDGRSLDGRLLLHDTRPWHGAREDEEWRSFAAAAKLDISDPGQGKRFNLSQLAIDAAIAGEGIAIGRLALILGDLDAGRLVPVFTFAVPAVGSYRLITERDAPPRIATIRSWLRDEAANFIALRDRVLNNLTIKQLD